MCPARGVHAPCVLRACALRAGARRAGARRAIRVRDLRSENAIYVVEKRNESQGVRYENRWKSGGAEA